jgi:hypothetical protein
MIAAKCIRRAIAQRSAHCTFCSVTPLPRRTVRFLSSAPTDLTPTKHTSAVEKISSDGVVGRTIDFDIAAKVEGNESQIVTITLEPGQILRAESGAMMYMTDGVQMETTTGGGLSSGFSRMLTGQNFFISDYSYTGDATGTVALGTDFPSKIVRLNVEEYGGKLICQKGALLCASHTIDIAMEYSKNLSTGFFGGEGFILQVSVYALVATFMAHVKFRHHVTPNLLAHSCLMFILSCVLLGLDGGR